VVARSLNLFEDGEQFVSLDFSDRAITQGGF
jgi:hypothetical protein